MENYCVPCLPQYVIASRKMLALTDDPSTTVWICDAHALEYSLLENYLIGKEDTIETMWEEEEARRNSDLDGQYLQFLDSLSNPSNPT